MQEKNFEANIRITSLSLLTEIESLTALCDSIIEIRRLIGFFGKVILEEVPNLKLLEKKTGGSLPDWVIGLSQGERVFVVKKSQWQNQKMDVSQLILHEFVHIALSQCVRKPLPVWLNEGLAVYLSGQYKDYKLEQSHIRAYVDFYTLSYKSEHLYIIAAKALVALVGAYGIDEVMKELFVCEEFETSRIFRNENLNHIVLEQEDDRMNQKGIE